MPLRDHFHRPDGRPPNWDRVHGGWPMVLIQHLIPALPEGYTVGPQVHIGTPEVDVAVLEQDDDTAGGSAGGGGGVAVATWAPPEPSLSVSGQPPDVDEYSARVYNAAEGERLVASVEFVSPANKDRPETRRMFAAKCAALLQEGVCVSVVDLVTDKHFNLYADLLDLLGHADPLMAGPPVPHIYAVTLRKRPTRRWRLDTWAHVLRVGEPLPSLPLWWSTTGGTMLDLETTYEEVCRTLRLRD